MTAQQAHQLAKANEKLSPTEQEDLDQMILEIEQLIEKECLSGSYNLIYPYPDGLSEKLFRSIIEQLEINGFMVSQHLSGNRIRIYW